MKWQIEPAKSDAAERSGEVQIAILLYDRLTALDAIGPYEVLSRIPGAELAFVATEPGEVRTDNGMLTLVAQRTLQDIPSPEIVLVPGGPGEVSARAGTEVLEWLRAAHETTAWTTSVCTGSLILGAAGLLSGKRATSHWLALDALRSLGAHAVSERVVFDGKIATAAGVSAGIDMALALVARVAGDAVAQAIQLGIEYDPQPPFDAGSPQKAPAEVVELLRGRSRFAEEAAASASGAPAASASGAREAWPAAS
jgi:transcriptional regulator GlxA family with amidase domain